MLQQSERIFFRDRSEHEYSWQRTGGYRCGIFATGHTHRPDLFARNIANDHPPTPGLGKIQHLSHPFEKHHHGPSFKSGALGCVEVAGKGECPPFGRLFRSGEVTGTFGSTNCLAPGDHWNVAHYSGPLFAGRRTPPPQRRHLLPQDVGVHCGLWAVRPSGGRRQRGETERHSRTGPGKHAAVGARKPSRPRVDREAHDSTKWVRNNSDAYTCASQTTYVST